MSTHSAKNSCYDCFCIKWQLHLVFTFNTLVDIQISFVQLAFVIFPWRKGAETTPLFTSSCKFTKEKYLNFCNTIGPLFMICKLKIRLNLSKLVNEVPRCQNKTESGVICFTTCFAIVFTVLKANSLSILFADIMETNVMQEGMLISENMTDDFVYNTQLCFIFN